MIMNTGFEQKFNSPTEELEWLRKSYESKKAELEKVSRPEKSVEQTSIASAVLREHADRPAESVLAPNYRLPESDEEDLVAKLLNLPPEDHDSKIQNLLSIAEEKGIYNAVAVARKLGNPHIEDDLHRALVQFFTRMDPAKQKKEKSFAKSLDMVLYEITLPRKEGEGKEGNKEAGFKEMVSAMEQFYNGMAMIGGGNSPASFTLELGVPTVGEEIVFYAAAPRSGAQMLEKHLTALFAGAKLEEKRSDYNIFKPEGVGAGAVLNLKTYSVLPIRTYDKFEVDPLLVIVNVFSKLKKSGEGASLQVIINGREESFNKKIKKTADEMRKGEKFYNALKNSKVIGGGILSFIDDLFFSSSGKDKKNENETKPVSDEGTVKLLDEKASKPVMSVNIRLLVSADTGERAEAILKEIESAFLQFTETSGNSLKFKNLKSAGLEKLFYNFSFRIFDKKEAVLLNTAELSTIFHFPASIGSISHLKYVKAKDAPPPLDLPEAGLLLGTNTYRGEEKNVYVKEDDRRRHFYVIGQTGTGKSVLLKNMVVQDMENGKGVCYIDPHGSDIEDILSRVPEDRVDDLIYFNPGNTERVMGLNMMEYDPKYPEQKTFIANEVYGIFRKIWKDVPEAFGPMFEQYYRGAILLVLDDPESGNTFFEVAKVLSDKKFREHKLSRARNPVVKMFWRDVAEKAGGEASLANIVPYITSKFDAFLSNEIMRPILVQEKSSFNFREIMDNKKILLVNLSKGRLGDVNSNLIGLIIVGKLLMAALSRVDMPEAERKDFYLYIDEFQNITTDSIAVILSEARKYRLNLTIAHQFIGQIEENIKKAVFGNVGSMCSFRVGSEDAEFLAKQFEPVFNAGDLLNISNYNSYLKVLISGQTSRPFNIATLPFKKGDANFADNITKLSSYKFGRPRAEVEEEINKRYNV